MHIKQEDQAEIEIQVCYIICMKFLQCDYEEYYLLKCDAV
jgi:hypothetical protein